MATFYRIYISFSHQDMRCGIIYDVEGHGLLNGGEPLLSSFRGGGGGVNAINIIGFCTFPRYYYLITLWRIRRGWEYENMSNEKKIMSPPSTPLLMPPPIIGMVCLIDLFTAITGMKDQASFLEWIKWTWRLQHASLATCLDRYILLTLSS